MLAAAGCASATAGTSGTSGPSGPSRTSGTSAHGPANSAAAITAAQASQAFTTYVATSAKAMRTDDRTLALSVVTGVQQAVLSGELKGAAAAKGSAAAKSSAEYAYGTPTFYLPEPSGLPHFFVAAVTRSVKDSKAAEGAAASVGGVPVPVDGRVLMLFQQSASAGPWQLASTSQLPAGLTLPRLATDSNGYIPQVPLTSTDLLAQPYATGPLQAAVVDDGPVSAAAKAVAAGPLTTGLYQVARDRSGTGLQVPAGDIYQWDMLGTPYPAFALRTADGGALVLYAMYLNSTVSTPGYINEADPLNPGPPIAVPQQLSALLPAGQPTPRVDLEAQDLFSFAAIDPPAGATKIQVLAIGGDLDYAAAS